MNFVTIIPARYSSTRLPKKPLIDINGKPMIIHVLNKAIESGSDRTIVATDHIEIASVVKEAGGEVCMTRSDHQSGIERLAEVIEKYGFNDETIIINVQGDEPMIPAKIINQVAHNLSQCKVKIETIAVLIQNIEEMMDPNVVKVVMNIEGYALYFSRAKIPWDYNYFFYNKRKIIGNNVFFRHIGIYGYRASFIRNYINWKPSPIEKIEMLEQLRILWYGEKIHVSVTDRISTISVDTQDDLIRVRNALQ